MSLRPILSDPTDEVYLSDAELCQALGGSARLEFAITRQLDAAAFAAFAHMAHAARRTA